VRQSLGFLAVFLYLKIAYLSLVASSDRLQISWPTPNQAFVNGLGYHAFLQKTGPDKDFSSGAFGCVRNNGHKFHEGIDLSPIKSSWSGKAEDHVYAAMDGIIKYVNLNASSSAYGKYIVIEHEKFTPTLYTLYGHLDSVSFGLKSGSTVKVAQQIGLMGNTASYKIPLNRSHLHFELGIRLSDRFDSWYSRQMFKTKNNHGNFNGYNLAGIDPLLFYSSFQKVGFHHPAEYLESLPVILKILVPSQIIPDLLRRNPSLSSTYSKNVHFNGWECWIGPYGIPLKFEASTSVPSDKSLRIIEYNEKYDRNNCRKLIMKKNGKLQPSELLKTYLEIIFVE
jgi:murein DD-endopeptidase MepM/ murein hydrolase activator NlpD